MRNQKIVIGLDTSSNQDLIYGVFWSSLNNTSLSLDNPVENCIILFGSMLPNLKGL